MDDRGLIDELKCCRARSERRERARRDPKLLTNALALSRHRHRLRGGRHLGAELAEGFTRLAPSLIVVAGYALAFDFLSLTLRDIPVGVAYAVWSGCGIALVSVIAWVLYHQTLGAGELTGMGFIVFGVVLLNLFFRKARLIDAQARSPSWTVAKNTVWLLPKNALLPK